MADPQIVNTLRTKKAEIERAIAHLEQQIKAARVDLMHVNATLRLFEIDPDRRLQFPAHVDLNRLFGRGEMVNLCKEALAASADPRGRGCGPLPREGSVGPLLSFPILMYRV